MFLSNLISSGLKVLLNNSKEDINLLAIEWLSHYISGSQKTKTLSESSIAELNPILASEISCHLRGVRKFSSCVSESPVGDTCWWGGLDGVVGAYQFKIVNIGEQGVKVKCWDKWDFNIDGSRLHIYIPKCLHRIMSLVLDVLRIDHLYNETHFCIEESILTRFNSSHEFYTRWETTVDWESIKLDGNDFVGKDINHPNYLIIKDGYCIPKWMEQKVALEKHGIELSYKYQEWYADLKSYWQQVKNK
jgi:hypothetical protein